MSRSIVRALVAAALVALVCANVAAQDKVKSDPRVASALSDLGLKYKVNSKGNFVVTYNQGKGRSQEVFVMSGTETYNNVEIREIWSNAGAFASEPELSTLEDLMTESGKNKIGGWALEKQDDGSTLLYYTVKFPAATANEAFQMILEFVADVADARELELFDADDN
jgi:hypothetical protein